MGELKRTAGPDEKVVVKIWDRNEDDLYVSINEFESMRKGLDWIGEITPFLRDSICITFEKTTVETFEIKPS